MPTTIASIFAAQNLIRSKHYDTLDGVLIFKQNKMFWYYVQGPKALQLVMSASKNLAQEQ